MKKAVLFTAILLGGVLTLYAVLLNNRPRDTNGDNSFTAVKDRGVLKVATTFGEYPWAAFDPSSGLATGGEPELARAIASELGVGVHFIDSDDPVLSVKSEEADAAFFRYFESDDPDVVLSDGYFSTGLAMVVRVDSAVSSAADLSGRRIAYMDSLCCPGARELIENAGGIPVEYDSSPAALADLEKQGVEAALLEISESAWYVRFHPILRFVGGDEDRFIASGASYGAILRKEDRVLLEEMNRAIARAKTKASFKDIISKWYLFKI